MKERHLEYYLKFRQELDKMWIPFALSDLHTESIKYKGKTVGLFCFKDNYIDCIYIEPEYRGRGIGTRTALEFYQKNKSKHIQLHILHSNKDAQRFWRKLFRLKRLESTYIDALYQIEGTREENQAERERSKNYEDDTQECLYTDSVCVEGEMFEPYTRYDRIKELNIDEMAQLFYGIIHARDLYLLNALKESGIDASLLEAIPEVHIAYHKQWLEGRED